TQIELKSKSLSLSFGRPHRRQDWSFFATLPRGLGCLRHPLACCAQVPAKHKPLAAWRLSCVGAALHERRRFARGCVWACKARRGDSTAGRRPETRRSCPASSSRPPRKFLAFPHRLRTIGTGFCLIVEYGVWKAVRTPVRVSLCWAGC